MSTGSGEPIADDDPLVVARREATRYADAVRDTEVFAARLDGDPDPDNVMEYAALLAREEWAHARRRDAFIALGFTVDSVES